MFDWVSDGFVLRRITASWHDQPRRIRALTLGERGAEPPLDGGFPVSHGREERFRNLIFRLPSNGHLVSGPLIGNIRPRTACAVVKGGGQAVKLTFDYLQAQYLSARRNGKVPIGWQLSCEGLRQISACQSPDPRDRYADNQPLTLLGLPYTLVTTRSVALVELIVRSRRGSG